MSNNTKNNTNNTQATSTAIQPTNTPNSTWVTVNTSTSTNVLQMEISKSLDFDKVVKRTR
jgi:hypothetical protein